MLVTNTMEATASTTDSCQESRDQSGFSWWIRYNSKSDSGYGSECTVEYGGCYKIYIHHKVLIPVIKRVIERPIAIQMISRQALINLDVPANTCPSMMSMMALISGTPGIR